MARLPRPRLGRAGRSPAARRSTPTWGISAGARSAWPGSASSCRALMLNYFGPGGAAPARSGGGGEPVLPPGAQTGSIYSAGHSRHRGGGDRLAGGDLRRLLAHPSGGAARLLPARRHHPHLEGGDRADLHPRGQLAADVRNSSAWCSVSASRRDLAAAYGIAVTSTMVITTLLAFVVERKQWKWSLPWPPGSPW